MTTDPTISRAGEVLPPAAAPARPTTSGRRRAPLTVAAIATDLSTTLRHFPKEPPRSRQPRHRAPEPFDAVLARELAAHGYSVTEYLDARGVA